MVPPTNWSRSLPSRKCFRNSTLVCSIGGNKFASRSFFLSSSALQDWMSSRNRNSVLFPWRASAFDVSIASYSAAWASAEGMGVIPPEGKYRFLCHGPKNLLRVRKVSLFSTREAFTVPSSCKLNFPWHHCTAASVNASSSFDRTNLQLSSPQYNLALAPMIHRFPCLLFPGKSGSGTPGILRAVSMTPLMGQVHSFGISIVLVKPGSATM